MVVELKVQYCREKLKISFDTIGHFYGVQFLNNSVKGFAIFHQLFQSAEDPLFYNSEITWTKHVTNTILHNSCMYTNRLRFFLQVLSRLINNCKNVSSAD